MTWQDRVKKDERKPSEVMGRCSTNRDDHLLGVGDSVSLDVLHHALLLLLQLALELSQPAGGGLVPLPGTGSTSLDIAEGGEPLAVAAGDAGSRSGHVLIRVRNGGAAANGLTDDLAEGLHQVVLARSGRLRVGQRSLVLGVVEEERHGDENGGLRVMVRIFKVGSN